MDEAKVVLRKFKPANTCIQKKEKNLDLINLFLKRVEKES